MPPMGTSSMVRLSTSMTPVAPSSPTDMMARRVSGGSEIRLTTWVHVGPTDFQGPSVPRRKVLSWSGSLRKSMTRLGSSPSRSPATIDSWRTQRPITSASNCRPSTPKARLARAGRPGRAFSNRKHFVLAAPTPPSTTLASRRLYQPSGMPSLVGIHLEVFERLGTERNLGRLAQSGRELGLERVREGEDHGQHRQEMSIPHGLAP